jgi:hypothetical protein
MKSHSILRTNVGLTTNAKILISGSYSLYVDSIISNSELSSTKYKKMEFNKDNYWDEVLPHFFKNTPVDIAFGIKDDNDNDNMSSDFSKQYDDIYQYGARNIIENKDYSEEFEYFAPLYISKTGLPSNFIIFRIDGPGLLNIDKSNFNSEIINKLKCVKLFDLTRKTKLGEWLEKNILKNKSFPNAPFYMDFRKLEFSTWIGIDYEDGGYSEKSFMMDTFLEYEQLYYEFEKFIFDGYKNNKVVFPNILNLSFLFDDTPATPSSLRKWSLNRYVGFYMDALELTKYVSPYLLPNVVDDVVIDKNNILYSLSNIDPFEQSFKKNDYPYIEISGDFYKIEKYLEEQATKLTKVKVGKNSYEDKPNIEYLTKYKIISNINLEGRQSEINKNLIKIDSLNKISFYNDDVFEIENYDDSDVWLIEIDSVYHNIIKTDGVYYIKTDYAFSQSLEKFEYYINSPDPTYRKTINLNVDSQNPPKKFAIYRCKFTDIMDFDTNIVETDFSKYEYIKKTQLTQTDETKMYVVNQESKSNPKDYDDFKINDVVVNIPTSSEYTANSETFRIIDNNLSSLWKKNAQRLKWGYQNSISSSDYPYLLNNSFISEDFNRTTNTFDPKPNRQERNLDYFLTINPDSNDYLFHSLHVVDDESIYFTTNKNINNKVVFINISNIGAFSIGDNIQITQDSGYTHPQYNTTAYITDIFYNATDNWCLTTDINFIVVTATNSGVVKNLTKTTFALNRYLNVDYDLDYFSYFFGKKTLFDSGSEIRNVEKWSYFNIGDNTIPNTTLFRGLKFKLYDVNGVKITDDKIDAINIKSNNGYSDYKFAILLSENNYVVNSSTDINIGNVNYGSNYLRWKLIDEWKHDKIYKVSSIVKFNDILYISSTQSQITNPSSYPYNSTDWGLFTDNNIFWSTNIDGSNSTTKNNMFYFGQTVFSLGVIIPPLVYNSGDYYYSSGINGNNFWIPGNTYSIDDVVLYKNKIWKANIETNTAPNNNNFYVDNGNYINNWSESPNSDVIWDIIELWQLEKTYEPLNSMWNSLLFSNGHYVVYNDVVYVTIGFPIRGLEPPLDSNWKRIYSLKPDTNYLYHNSFSDGKNPIIEMNNRLYFCVDNDNPTSISTTLSKRGQPTVINNTPLSTLENGINIYINKKWKNVLVNIYINDNTFSTCIDLGFSNWVVENDNISNTNRDDLYSDIYKKLTANNFMQAINDLENNYDFSDKIRYIIINEDLSLNIYDFNDFKTLEKLPVLLKCDTPDEFLTRIQSNNVDPITLEVSEIKPNKKLDLGNVVSLNQLNYYSDLHLATKIEKRKDNPLKVENYSGLKNNIYNNLYRHSGYYSPIFNKIELFKAPTLEKSGGNYKFDTDLTYFGTIKERIFSKVNRSKNILKLRNNPNIKSIYPMLDEYGYFIKDFFIFKSTWDLNYHIECLEIPQKQESLSNESLVGNIDNNNTNNNNLSQL